MSLTRRICEGCAIVIALTMLTVMATRLTSAHGLLLANGQPLFGDFIGFWSAGRLALEGKAALVFDHHATFAVQHALIPAMRVQASWNGPPTFLLISAFFATMPYPVAALMFLFSTGALYLFAARKLLPDARAMLFAVTLPAALYHPGTVQIGLLIAGASGLALYWLDKRPRAAGALIALLAIKPHLAVLWPVYLAISRRWTAFAAATICTIVFLLVVSIAFGFDSYVRFFNNLSVTADLVSRGQIAAQTYASLYGSLLGLHVSHIIAASAQAISGVSAIAMAVWIFWRGDRIAQGAALCAATLLVSPYLFFYDFTLLAVAAALLSPPRDRLEFAAVVLAWLSALSVAAGFFITLPYCPTAAWLMLIAALRRTGNAALHPAPAPRM